MKNKFLLISSTHGDEGFSVPILQNLEKKFSKIEFGYDWIIGNEQAYKLSTRFTKKDLNRSAPGNENSTIYEEKRASEIIKLSSKYNYIIDLHGAISNCGVVSIIPLPTFANLVLASIFDLKRNVIWYTKSSFKNGPLVQFSKCPAIEIECGPKDSKKINATLQKALENFLKYSKNLSISKVLKRVMKKDFFVVYDKLGGEPDATFKDFTRKSINGETFYPFMSNQYPGIICYKMKKIKLEDLFLH